MTSRPYEFNPRLTEISLMFDPQERGYVADIVSPRVEVQTSTFKYTNYDIASQLRIPNTQIGRRGIPDRQTFTSNLVTGSCFDHVVVTDLPRRDLDDSFNPDLMEEMKTRNITGQLSLARELRVANQFLDPANFATEFKTELSADDLWTNASSDIIGQIETARRLLLFDANGLVFSGGVWSHVRQHPQIVEAVKNTGVTSGMASVQAVADLLEIEYLVIAKAKYNAAAEGQTTSNFSYVWGDSAVLFYHNPSIVLLTEQTSFSFTAEHMAREVSNYYDPEPGAKGIEVYKVAESIGEITMSDSNLGYLFEDVI